MLTLSRTVALVVGVLPHTAALAQDPEAKVVLEPFTATLPDGTELRAERGRLRVPENRRVAGSRTIELVFVRVRSTADRPGPPLIYLHGGPGGAGTTAARSQSGRALWSSFLDLGDVVLLDQRGCGGSKPNLTRPLPGGVSSDLLVDRAASTAALTSAARQVAAQLAAEGVDVTGYDTEQSADDVNDLREALGADKMRLLGFSYGTHLGLSVLRRHGECVDRAILIGVEGPNHTRKLPSAYDTHIKKLSVLVARDPDVGADVPDFAGLLRRVLDKLDREPVTVSVRPPGSSEAREVRIGAFGLRLLLLWDFGDTNDLPVFPRLLHELDRGETATLVWFAQKRQLGAFPTLLFTMDPVSGCSADRRERIQAEARWSLMGDVMNFDTGEIEALFGMQTLGDDFRRPLVCQVPTLFLSGDLDANTPPYQAEEMRWGFVDSVHLVQSFGGHEDWLRNAKVPPVLHAFLAGEDVSGRDVDMPALRFIPVRGPAGAVRHPSVGG